MRMRLAWLVGALSMVGPAPASAFTINPGQSLEVSFTLTGTAPSANTLTFNLVNVVALAVASMTVELYDGTTLLASKSGVPVSSGPTGQPAGFVDVDSDWTLNAVAADLGSVRAGTIVGRIRVIPDFGVSGALTAGVGSLLIGDGFSGSGITPLDGLVLLGTVSVVPEPSVAVLLGVSSALLVGCSAARASAERTGSRLER